MGTAVVERWWQDLFDIKNGDQSESDRQIRYGRLRAEFLDQYLLENLDFARLVIAARERQYEDERPHSSLGGLTLARRGIGALTLAEASKKQGAVDWLKRNGAETMVEVPNKKELLSEAPK